MSGDLHPDQLTLIYEQKWFKMFVPVEYGGLGWSLPRVLNVEEALSWADGSTGWVVTLCSGAGWFSGFIEPTLLKEMLPPETMCIAGSGAPGGVALATGDGYEITGRWKYASGAMHATLFTANCIVEDESGRQQNPGDPPAIAAFLFLKEEVVVHPTWKSIGMVATGSHSFEAEKLVVPANRRFIIEGKYAWADDPVYRYPFQQLAETTLSVNLSGMAVRFLDLCGPLLAERARRRGSTGADADERLDHAWLTINRYRSDFYRAVQRSWAICERGEEPRPEVLHEVSQASYALAHGALRLVDELYPYCGMPAADPREEISRVWRNIHTASQHALFTMTS